MQPDGVEDADFINPNAYHLTHEQAIAREKAIQTLHSYELFLSLHKRVSFEGVVKITATFAPNVNSVVVDFHGQKVKQVVINGKR